MLFIRKIVGIREVAKNRNDKKDFNCVLRTVIMKLQKNLYHG